MDSAWIVRDSAGVAVEQVRYGHEEGVWEVWFGLQLGQLRQFGVLAAASWSPRTLTGPPPNRRSQSLQATKRHFSVLEIICRGLALFGHRPPQGLLVVCARRGSGDPVCGERMKLQ